MRKFMMVGVALMMVLTLSAQQRYNRVQEPSVKINQDGSVTFSIHAPNAQKVSIRGDVPNSKPFVKGEDGMWRMTLPKMDVSVYRYTFDVDGVSVIDPRHPKASENVSIVEILPEGVETFWSKKDVPHGAVSEVYYKSTTLNPEKPLTRRMQIWTPAGYNASKAKLPVLYLIHGAGDNDTSWNRVGKAGDILDNLLAEGKIEPMIVVMPNGSIPTELFPDELVKDIIPYVEQNYRCKRDAANRAIAGLSMGGLETLNTFMAYPDMFTYISVMSSYWFDQGRGDGLNKRETRLKEITPILKKRVKLLRFTQGSKQDFTYDGGLITMKAFDRCGIEYEFSEMPGGHSWHVWRHDLRDFVTRIFK